MTRLLIVAVLSLPVAANAQVIANAPGGFVVASSGRMDRFDAAGRKSSLLVRSVERPSKIVASGDQFAIIDSFADRIAIVRDLVTRFVDSGATPIDAMFAGADLIVLTRDGNSLERHRPNGDRATIPLAPDSAFMRQSDGFIYVYSRLEGSVQEISLSTFAVTRRATIAPFASDFEIDDKNGYLLFPREAKLRAFPLSTLKVMSEVAAGGAPVDMALLRRNSALSASRIAIADPAAKRVWTMEGLQSVGGAFGRGFLRGLLGLRLFAPTHSAFPTGVDRVTASGDNVVAFDSTTGTVYRVRGSKIETIAKGIAATGFTVGENGIAILENDSIRIVP